MNRVIVDATLQEKATTHPTDSRSSKVARTKSVHLVKRAGAKFKLTTAIAYLIT